jgi:hypothetical protein
MNYAQQIKHPNWQKKRLEVLEFNDFQCENCGESGQELHVHHPFYKRGAMIWQYDLEELMCLCHKCHKDAHAKDEEIKYLLADRNICKSEVIGVLKAMNDSPYTQLDSYEEVEGYLNYYGISGELQDTFITEIIHEKGIPDNFISHSPFDTTYRAIGEACFKEHKDIISLLKASQKIHKTRMAAIKARRSRNANPA